MMTLPMIKTPKRLDTSEPARRRGRRFFVWDTALADPAAIEGDYHRMARRQQERSARLGGYRA